MLRESIDIDRVWAAQNERQLYGLLAFCKIEVMDEKVLHVIAEEEASLRSRVLVDNSHQDDCANERAACY